MSLDVYHLGDDVNQIEAATEGSAQTANAVDVRPPVGLALQLASSARAIVVDTPPAQAADENRPSGAVFVVSPECPGGRIYICDQETHMIDVLDRNGRPLFSFGGYGSSLGQFDTPTDVAVVPLDAVDSGGETLDAVMLVVADRGNHRLQMFELDGAVVGEIGSHAGAWISGRFPALAGSPFFRLGDVPPLPFPSRLDWRAPYLDVACAGTAIRLDLAAVLLPEFATWIAEASHAELRLAFLRFATDPNGADIPETYLYEIAERLQPTWRRGAVLPRRSA